MEKNCNQKIQNILECNRSRITPSVNTMIVNCSRVNLLPNRQQIEPDIDLAEIVYFQHRLILFQFQFLRNRFWFDVVGFGLPSETRVTHVSWTLLMSISLKYSSTSLLILKANLPHTIHSSVFNLLRFWRKNNIIL